MSDKTRTQGQPPNPPPPPPPPPGRNEDNPVLGPTRDKQNALAFLSSVVKSVGGELRPPSLYSLNCMQLLDLLATDDEGKAAVKLRSDALAARDMSNVYLYLHVAPVPEIERAIRAYDRVKNKLDPDEAWDTFLADRVAPFLATLAPEEVVKLQEELGKLEEIGAAQVSAEPPADGKPERPDPNS